MAPPPKKVAPRVSVLDRRLQNPFGEPSAPVALKERSRVARWFNAAILTDKIWRAKQKGWDPVRPDEIVDLDQIGGHTISPEGYVTRGDRGHEVLMSMPRDAYTDIARAKAIHNTRTMGHPSAQRKELIEAVGQKYGDEAATFVGQSRPVGEVRDSYERIESREGEES